jgi:hypothetical protein
MPARADRVGVKRYRRIAHVIGMVKPDSSWLLKSIRNWHECS